MQAFIVMSKGMHATLGHRSVTEIWCTANRSQQTKNSFQAENFFSTVCASSQCFLICFLCVCFVCVSLFGEVFSGSLSRSISMHSVCFEDYTQVCLCSICIGLTLIVLLFVQPQKQWTGCQLDPVLFIACGQADQDLKMAVIPHYCADLQVAVARKDTDVLQDRRWVCRPQGDLATSDE